jgi:hypothetical protein
MSIVSQLSYGEPNVLYYLDHDPTLSPGQKAPIFSYAKYNGDLFLKTGTGDLDWIQFSGEGVNGTDIKFVHEVLDVTAQVLSEKKLILSHLPVANSGVILIPDGGVPQRQGVDFIVAGNEVSFDGLGLDGFLEEGEQVYFYYTKSISI